MPIFFPRCALALALSCAAISQAQATMVTLSSGGTIYGGIDDRNLFKAGRDLTGKAYTQTLTIDTDLLDVRERSTGVNARLTIYGPVKVHGTMTVEGQTYAWDIGFGIGEVNMWNSAGGPRFPLSFMGVHGYGQNLQDDLMVNANADYADDNPAFLSSVDFAQQQNLSGLSGYMAHTGFWVRGYDGVETGIDAFPEWLRWEGVNAVPEPGTLALALLGLGVGLGMARQRQRHTR
ncbi:PEP-CTERM sorting domain-containing protein [Massilia sp. CF038]|uniref:PEP-CTERM sorting domain-containing protein n=1 Tax=Massilia sp. CF038 TaxID=1881045 RepID=UPI0009129DDB|nr:PEP-CTERM sorting domain-containing protein [Massilia sp. CF038]SHH54145.1 PEP-CTERM protein-sorting domain-containing protein [Massilia sp. CF038]